MDTVDEKLDKEELEMRVKQMYTDVAEKPKAEYHFEMGRGLAEKLGYPPGDLDRIPAAAVDSFAGVGYHFGLAQIRPGERVLDLGSGAGMDLFLAAVKAGPSGQTVGVDMTDAQLAKAENLKKSGTFQNITLVKSYIEKLSLESESFDVVISNGVINLSPDKEKVFAEIARVLKLGGRLALSDIVTSHPLSERIKSSAELWAACIGGAVPQEDYIKMIETAGMRVAKVQENTQYHFLTHEEVMEKYGVKSISLLALKD